MAHIINPGEFIENNLNINTKVYTVNNIKYVIPRYYYNLKNIGPLIFTTGFCQYKITKNYITLYIDQSNPVFDMLSTIEQFLHEKIYDILNIPQNCDKPAHLICDNKEHIILLHYVPIDFYNIHGNEMNPDSINNLYKNAGDALLNCKIVFNKIWYDSNDNKFNCKFKAKNVIVKELQKFNIIDYYTKNMFKNNTKKSNNNDIKDVPLIHNDNESDSEVLEIEI